MNNKNIVVDLNSIANTKKSMEDECNKIAGMLNNYKAMFDDLKRIYDTESATLYRTVASKYLDLMSDYLNNDFKVYVNSLDNIKKVYEEELQAISNSINGGVA